MVRWCAPPTHSSWGCRDVCVSTVSIVVRGDGRVLRRMRNSQFDATIVATISCRRRRMVCVGADAADGADATFEPCMHLDDPTPGVALATKTNLDADAT